MDKRNRPGPALLAGLAAAASVAALTTATLSTSPAEASGPSGSGGKPISHAHLLLTDPVPTGFSSWPQAISVQAKLHKAALRITDAAEASGGDRLGAVTADLDDRAVNVYWKGSVPDRMQTLLSTLRHEVPVRLHPTRFGLHQLLAEQMRLAHDPTVTASGQVTEIAALPDASGLQVTLRPHRGIDASTKSDAAARAARSSSTVPVVVTSGDMP